VHENRTPMLATRTVACSKKNARCLEKRRMKRTGCRVVLRSKLSVKEKKRERNEKKKLFARDLRSDEITR